METGAAVFLISSFCFIGWDQELEAGKAGCQFPVSIFQFLPCAKRCRLFVDMPPVLLYWRKTFVKFESK